MPPRYAYWTILIDQQPTAFRAKDREELLPTFAQLQRKNPDVVMKWFARGRLWDSPEQAQWSQRNLPPVSERRGPEWRPGGKHEDPRARFDKPKRERQERKPWENRGSREDQRPAPDAQRPEAKRPWTPRPDGDRKPWKPKGEGKPRPEGDRKPWKPKGEWKPRDERFSRGPAPDAQTPRREEQRPRPEARGAEAKRPWTPRPEGERRPWKPKGEWKPRPEGDRKPWKPKGEWKPRAEGDRRPWKPKSEFDKPGARSPKPGAWHRHGPKGPKKRD